MRIPDPEGAAILIETANQLANNPFKIDVGQLQNDHVELKKQMQQLINAMQKQQQGALHAGGAQGITANATPPLLSVLHTLLASPEESS